MLNQSKYFLLITKQFQIIHVDTSWFVVKKKMKMKKKTILGFNVYILMTGLVWINIMSRICIV